MENLLQFTIAILVLILGIPIGNYLAFLTKEELKSGQKYFKAIIIVCLVGSIASLIFKNDALFFTFLFIAIVTSRSVNS